MNTPEQLISALSKFGIPFCVWKNLHQENEFIVHKTDIDLHIPTSSKVKFKSFCLEFNGLEVASVLSDYPYISHFLFLGQDGNLIHIHVYFEIFTGESHLKDYLFPISQQLINTKKPHPVWGFVASTDMAWTLYILRHYLKCSSFLGVLTSWKERADISSELNYLKILNPRLEPIPFLDSTYVETLEAALKSGGVFKKWWLGKKLRFKLRSLKRMHPIAAGFFGYTTMVRRVINKIFIHHKKSLVGSGSFIAITGLDGAGKTSLIEELCKPLRKKTTVKQVHLGRPPATLFTYPFRMVLWLYKLKPNRSKPTTYTPSTLKSPSRIIGALRYTILAHERRRLSQKIIRWKAKGFIIISDRYPSITLGKMDSPRIDITGKSGLFKKLGEIEQQAYQSILPPDLLIEVVVTIETAQKRNASRQKKGKETVEELIARHQENSNLSYIAKQHIKFENNGELEPAKEKIRKIAWRSLVGKSVENT